MPLKNNSAFQVKAQEIEQVYQRYLKKITALQKKQNVTMRAFVQALEKKKIETIRKSLDKI